MRTVAVAATAAAGAFVIAVPSAIAEERLGKWVIRPVIESSMTYNDNVFLTTKRKKADRIGRLTPGLYISRPLAKGALDTSWGVDAIRYIRQSELSATTYMTNADLQYDATNRLNLRFSNALNYTPSVQVRDSDAYLFFTTIGDAAAQDPSLLNRLLTATRRADRLQHTFGAAASYGVSEDVSVDIDVRQDTTYYDYVVFSRSRAVGLGGNVKTQLTGRDTLWFGTRSTSGARQVGVSSKTNDLRGTWQHTFSDKLSVDTRLVLSRTREKGRRGVPDEFVGTSLSYNSAARSTDTASLDFVGVAALPEDIRLRVGVGANSQRDQGVEGQGAASRVGPNFTIGLDKPLPFRNGTLTLDFDRTLTSGYRGGVTTRQMRAAVTYAFNPRTELETSLWRTDRHTTFGTDVDYRSWGLDTAVVRRLSERASLRFSWSHLDQVSAGIVGTTSKRNLFTISFSADL